MTSMTNDELKAANARYLWHPMAQLKAMHDTPPDIIVRGEGSWIWDVDGHRLVDGVAGLWSANLGFGRAEIRDAIVAQLDDAALFQRVSRDHAPARHRALLPGRENDGAGRRRGRVLQQRRLRCGGRSAEARASVLEGPGAGRSDQVHRPAAGLSRRAFRRHERQRQYQLPPSRTSRCCRAASTSTRLGLYRNPYTEDPARLGEICAELLEREITVPGRGHGGGVHRRARAGRRRRHRAARQLLAAGAQGLRQAWRAVDRRRGGDRVSAAPGTGSEPACGA